jgi:hypothetical protein
LKAFQKDAKNVRRLRTAPNCYLQELFFFFITILFLPPFYLEMLS